MGNSATRKRNTRSDAWLLIANMVQEWADDPNSSVVVQMRSENDLSFSQVAVILNSIASSCEAKSNRIAE